MDTVSEIIRNFSKGISRQQCIQSGILLTACIFLIHMLFVNLDTSDIRIQNMHLDRFIQHLDVRPGKSGSKHSFRILYWTPFNTGNQLNMENACMRSCPVKCVLTDNKSDIANVDLVNFHLTDLWTENWKINTKAVIKFPCYRRPDQIWLLTNLEPPPNLFGNLRVFNGKFNWTVWYRQDATLHLPYGVSTRLNSMETEAVKKSMETRNFYKEKSGEVTGVISNCKDTNRRYRFIKDLKKHLDINMFGHCYNQICGDPLRHDSCDNVTSKYKFYLALENSRCKDYVTEKYWASLNREQIPIVNWDLKSVSKDIPIPGSYISISDFKDAKSLADYIKRVSKNETLYNSYFEWKKRYKITKACSSCLACKALHEGRDPQVIENLDGWVRNDVCQKVELLNNLGTKIDEFLFWKLGV